MQLSEIQNKTCFSSLREMNFDIVLLERPAIIIDLQPENVVRVISKSPRWKIKISFWAAEIFRNLKVAQAAEMKFWVEQT